MKVLAGDIGGTNARLAVVEAGQVLLERIYPSKDFTDFLSLLHHFFSETGISVPERACFGVAGVVHNSVVVGTNLAWEIDADQVKRRLRLRKVCLINDFAAAALGILETGPEWLEKIGPGESEKNGNKAVLGPGTGLGEAILVASGNGKYDVVATEGGHCDFAPTDQNQVRLLEYLWRQYGHASCERVLSGPGLANIYNFLLLENGEVVPAAAQPADITKAAMQGDDNVAVEALDTFCRILGAEAGNLALKCLARGGVYIAGGIAPRIVDFLKKGAFRSGFENKGRMKALLETIPTYVVTNKDLGLLGAAAKALEL